MIRNGILPSVSIGQDRRVPRAALEEWVAKASGKW
jgi:excisionase family DNA binding protein